MNTSNQAIEALETALANCQNSSKIIENLIAPHDYQDVALILSQASEKLIEATLALMNKDDENALDMMSLAEDFIDDVYDTIEGDLDS